MVNDRTPKMCLRPSALLLPTLSSRIVKVTEMVDSYGWAVSCPAVLDLGAGADSGAVMRSSSEA